MLATDEVLSGAKNGLYLQLTASDEDWECPSCGADCFGSKEICYKCDASKPGTNGDGCRTFGMHEGFDSLCVAIHSHLHAHLSPAQACRHRWVCLRDRVHNKADGRGKYMAYKCSDCGAFQRRYLK